MPRHHSFGCKVLQSRAQEIDNSEIRRLCLLCFLMSKPNNCRDCLLSVKIRKEIDLVETFLQKRFCSNKISSN